MSDTDGKDLLSVDQNDSDHGRAGASPSGRKSKSPTPSLGSKKGSRIGSSKSGARLSASSSKVGKSPSRVGSSASHGKNGSSSSVAPDDASVHGGTGNILPLVEGTEEPMEGVVAIFLTSKTQEIIMLRADEDVTGENIYKIIKKADILEDMKMRAGVSDFTPMKKEINAYPGDEILFGYDADFVFGQNFFICLTEEIKEHCLTPPKKEMTAEEAEALGIEYEGDEPVDDRVYKYIPPVSKPWVSQGSEKEIEEESIVLHRVAINMSMKRVRREFGAPVFFSDRNVSDAKDGYIECVPFEDATFDVKAQELTKGVQAMSETHELGTQTDWKHPRNANTQYFPREFTEQEKQEVMESDDLHKFVDHVVPRFELALQQNEIMDVFYNDWEHLGDGDDSFGRKAESHLKEYQSFTDLQFSKEKIVTAIEWHPNIKGVLAVSAAEKYGFDDRIDQGSKIIMTPSLILIWSFTDPIHPQLLLEAPDDILCFKFCPSDSNVIVGGCHNGQIVLWDISAYTDRLKQSRSSNKNNKRRGDTLPGFEDENSLKTPIVRYCAVSSIEHSHKAPVTDILWVPDHFEINRMGVPAENKSGECCQIMSSASDYCVFFWDTRPQKTATQSSHSHHDKPSKSGLVNAYKHLDLTWRPLLKVTLHKAEPGGDHSPTKFTIQETHGEKGLAASKQSEEDLSSQLKPDSSKDRKTLDNIQTHFYIGTEDGELVYVDWMPQKDHDTGKIATPKPEFYHCIHDGPIVGLQRSPFFKDILLCVGGWSFTIWKEGLHSGPILHSAASPVRLTAAHWSPSRPAVFYISRNDGSVDVWDLLDKTHEPIINQNVSALPITTVYPYQVSQKQHLLAVGDNAGTLHILEIPWSLTKAVQNEMTAVANYFDREVKRRSFVVNRWEFREQEKRELESDTKKKAGIAPLITLSDEEIENRLKTGYQTYLEEEAAFLRGLGLVGDSDETLAES